MPKNVKAFLNIFVESKELDRVTEALVKLPEVIDVYEVTGEYDLVTLVTTETISSFRDFLKNKVLKIDGVRSTVTAMIIYTHKREGKLISE
jgi:DNA-binding Lrp family transcriptional regulator